MATRRVFTREFKLEAVKLASERGVSIAQACRDLGLHVSVLRKWVRDQKVDPQHAFPGQGQMEPQQAGIAALKKEVAKLRMGRYILRKAAAWFAKVDVKFGRCIHGDLLMATACYIAGGRIASVL